MERGDPGFEVTAKLGKPGVRASETTIIRDAGRTYASQAAMAKLYTGRMVRLVCTEALDSCTVDGDS